MQLESNSIQHEYKHTMELWIQRPLTWVNTPQETWNSCHRMRQVFLYPNFILQIHEAEWKLSAKEPGIWQCFLEISLEFSSVGISVLFPSSIWCTYEVEATADFSISFVHWVHATMPILLPPKNLLINLPVVSKKDGSWMRPSHCEFPVCLLGNDSVKWAYF